MDEKQNEIRSLWDQVRLLRNQLYDANEIIEAQGKRLDENYNNNTNLESVQVIKLKNELSQGREAISEFTNHIKELESRIDVYETYVGMGENNNVIEELQEKLRAHQEMLDIKDNHIKELEKGQLEVLQNERNKANVIQQLQSEVSLLRDAMTIEEKSNNNSVLATPQRHTYLRNMSDGREEKLYNDYKGLGVMEGNKDIKSKLMLAKAKTVNLELAIEEKNNYINTLQEQIKQLHLESSELF